MKNFNKLAILTFAMFGFAVTANAQSDATSTSSATIVTPIAIVKDVDMNFGNVAVTKTAGSVVLSSAGGRTAVNGVTLPTKTGTVAAAKFTVTGQADYTYVVTLPTGDHTITGATVAKPTMTVNTFTSSLTNGTGTLTGGSQVITVGATLNVAANQAADVYTSGTGFTVTVNYN